MTDWVEGDVRVLVGKAEDRLRELADASAHCCVTSPPYWNLRDYGVPGQLGLEATPDEYVCRMVEVFREVRRVLRPDGTLWLNLGDSYASNAGGAAGDAVANDGYERRNRGERGRGRAAGLKPKDLALLPAEVALALRRDGWWLRADIAWCKRSPMPESIRDRPTSAWEHVFLLSRSEAYFYDQDAVREPHEMRPQRRPTGRPDDRIPRPGQPKQTWPTAARDEVGVDGHPNGRNMWNYWVLGPEPYPDAHFAVMPTEVARRCIAAGTSERGCCVECGAPRRRVVERGKSLDTERPPTTGAKLKEVYGYDGIGRTTPHGRRCGDPVRATTGWEPTCAHEAEPVPCTVLDPFAGSGTTLAVAKRMGRAAIGIELQANYLPLIQRRVRHAVHQPALFELPPENAHA